MSPLTTPARYATGFQPTNPGGLPGLVATPSARAYLQVVRVLMMRKAPAVPAMVGQGRTQPMSNVYAN